MTIFDAHLDLAINAVDWNRDLRVSVADLRAQERAANMAEPGRGRATVTFPELKRAGVRTGVATVIARFETPVDHAFGWSSPEACYASAMGQLAYYRAMERSGWVRQLRTRADLRDHAAAAARDPDAVPFGFILSMECADPILDVAQLDEWYAHGLRAVGLTHYGANRYGGGTRSEVGLTLDAVPLLKAMERLGIALDLTHLSDRAFRQVATHFNGRVLASHQNCRVLCDWSRQFTDEQVKFTVERGGVIGIAFDAIMLQTGWVRGSAAPTVTIEAAVDHIDHICQLAGHARCVGIGSDLDGGYGTEQTPADLDTIADLRKLPELLERRGYRAADIQGILTGNWLRFFAEVLPG